MLECVSFICGAAVMVLEMAGARVLAPHLGTSIVVWTALIGVILASLSVGYWAGGRLGDKNPSAATLGKIIATGAGLVLMAAILQVPVLETTARFGWPLQVSAVAAAVVLFSIPAMLLGMVSPYIIQVKRVQSKTPDTQTGSVMGRFFAISTIGSIAGTFLGGYWLVSWLGTRVILYAVAGALSLAALLTMPGKQRKPVAFLLFACLALGLLTARTAETRLSVGIEQDSRYNHLKILEGLNAEGRKVRCLLTDPGGTAQSCMFPEDPDALVFQYTRHYAIGWHMVPDAKDFLMLGGGGYSVPKYLLAQKPDAMMDVVEIDPAVTAAAENFFCLKKNPRLRIFHEDARVFLNRHARSNPPAQYDVIMGDTFTSSYNIPFHLGTVECAEKIKTLLRDDGVFICNIISLTKEDEAQVLHAIHGAFAQVFPQTHIFPVYPDRFSQPQ
ncbi:fused MFS/spermidine synthase, partial [Desulfosarcina sp. OttesenSCG-928-G10]|nr:fused MFS/spermidine synthase [Desulfosarcina sp. OttesenSCG-928-G10]